MSVFAEMYVIPMDLKAMCEWAADAMTISRIRRTSGLWVAMCAFLLPAGLARAVQEEGEPKTVRVAAGEQYATSHAGQDWLLGFGYRDLWAATIEVELLELGETAGGLSPVMRVGGLQTLGLALSGEDGRAYTFRSVDKEGLLALPDGFKDSGLTLIIQDQVSSSLPAADLIAAGLAGAIGVLHADAKLVVMPDDPRLGEFRESFAGVPRLKCTVPIPAISSGGAVPVSCGARRSTASTRASSSRTLNGLTT